MRITQGTVCVLLRHIAELLMPGYDLMVGRVKASKMVMTDDTVMPMQAPDKVKQAQLWACIGDEENPYHCLPLYTDPVAGWPQGVPQGLHRHSGCRCVDWL